MKTKMPQQKHRRWDVVRFIQTLAYFEVIPFYNWVMQLFQNRTKEATAFLSLGVGKQVAMDEKLMAGKSMELILVAGATGGVGKRVVQRLLERGYKVRALVRDVERARTLLGNEVELFAADITKPETITSELMTNIQAVVCCTGARVQPVEGDTPERAKYYQGVKFYQPEVVGDSPETVEYLGVKHLVEATTPYLVKAAQPIIFDFTNPSVELKNIWGAVDDVVMGGVSESSIRLLENTALFNGNVSTANSGGFASVRTRNFEPPLNLAGYEGVELRLKGDGNRYKFILRNDARWDGIGYSYAFDTVENSWINVRVPFNAMTPVFRAKTLQDAPPVDPSHIHSLQLMLSKFEYDGELNPKFAPGSFQLQVESIKAYSSNEKPRFVLVSSAGVTRPGRPGIDLAQEPPAVQLNDQLGGILTWKLKGEDSVRASGVTYTIIRPCALTEEPGVQALMFDQGDHLKGKVSRDSIAEICIQTLSQPKACNVTFEVKATESSSTNNWEQLFAQLQPDNQPSAKA